MIEAFADPDEATDAALLAPSGPADIVFGYRLLLGREPAAADVDARTGQPIEVLLHSLADSAEHRSFVRAPLISGAPFAADRFAAPPDAAIADWLARITGEPLAAEARVSWRALLRRTRLALALQAPPPACPPSALDVDAVHPAGRDDLERLYRLVLGREVDSYASLAAHVGPPGVDVAAGLIASEEFRLRVVAEVVAGRLSADEDALPIADLRWARARFGLDLAPYARRSQALAALVETPAVARALARLSLAWSPEALVEFIRAQAVQDAAAADRPPAIEAIQRLSRNVELQAVKDIEVVPGGVRFTSDDPNLLFRLNGESAAAPAVELAFAMGGARRRAAGVLYLDYGEGLADGAIPLTPRGRTAAPRGRHASLPPQGVALGPRRHGG